MKIGVSRCLLGEKTRYDGGSKPDEYIKNTLGSRFSFVPLCPEVEYGFSVPREVMRLAGDPASPRIVEIHTGEDHTEGMKAWAAERLEGPELEGLGGFIFKSRSPSCGIHKIKVYPVGRGATSTGGTGIFARSFMDRFPQTPVIDEAMLAEPAMRENFFERAIVLDRWFKFLRNGVTAGGLVEFHACHKLVVLAHSPKHAVSLGRLVASSKGNEEKIADLYIETMMEGLCLAATARKHVNVLMHIMGYFKKMLTAHEKQELLDLVEEYRNGWAPLTLPLAVLNGYVKKYDEPYLAKQHYLTPQMIQGPRSVSPK